MKQKMMQDILPLRSKQVRLVALRILNSSESPIRVIIHSWLETRWSSSSRLDQPWTLVSVQNGRRNHLIDFCGIIRTDDSYHPLQSLRARSGRISSRKDETAKKRLTAIEVNHGARANILNEVLSRNKCVV